MTAAPRASPSHALRAAGVALVWALAGLPVLVGRASCPMAEIFGVPCPGCGMTRAGRLLLAGEVGASLRMHPLVVPTVAASLLFMGATVWVTATLGGPSLLWRSRLGRASVVLLVAVQAAGLSLWVARLFGCLGGPVPV